MNHRPVPTYANEDFPSYDDGDVGPPYLEEDYPLNFLHDKPKRKKRKPKPVVQHFDTSTKLRPFEEETHFNDHHEFRPNNLNRPHNEHAFNDNELHHFGDQNDHPFRPIANPDIEDNFQRFHFHNHDKGHVHHNIHNNEQDFVDNDYHDDGEIYNSHHGDYLGKHPM